MEIDGALAKQAIKFLLKWFDHVKGKKKGSNRNKVYVNKRREKQNLIVYLVLYLPMI